MRTPQVQKPAAALLSAVSACEVTLTDAGHRMLGKVIEGARAIDLAFVSHCGHSTVVRCVDEPEDTDRTALATMLAQGDFIRAAIVYTSESQPQLSGEIATYPLSRIDELAALLAKESAA